MLSLLATSVVFKDNALERQRLTFFAHPCRFIIAKEDGKNSPKFGTGRRALCIPSWHLVLYRPERGVLLLVINRSRLPQRLPKYLPRFVRRG